MRNSLSNPGSAAVIASLLCAPITLLVALVAQGIEPDFGPLEPAFAMSGDGPQVLGSAIVFGCVLLLPAALLVALAPVARNARAGNSIAASPANLLLAAAILLLIAVIADAVVVDQYPCWIGVPNCD